nr:hypothetical protein [Tanacetum cinerariifolium]
VIALLWQVVAEEERPEEDEGKNVGVEEQRPGVVETGGLYFRSFY